MRIVAPVAGAYGKVSVCVREKLDVNLKSELAGPPPPLRWH